MITTQDQTDRDQVWDAFRKRRPIRVPCTLIGNPRIYLMDPELNTDGTTFEQAATDPEVHVMTQLKCQLYRRTVLNRFSDDPVGLPDRWEIQLEVYNIYDAAFFGAEIDYHPGQVPDTIPPYTDEDHKEAVFDIDITRPLENPFIRRQLDFWHEMDRICRDLKFEGRPVRMMPWALMGVDGPVTVGCNLRGTEFLMDLAADPDYAIRVMNRIVDMALNRRRAFREYWGDRLTPGNGLADDSIAMLSPAMYREQVLPVHRRYYAGLDPADGEFSMHLCGDATRHFKTIVDELGVRSFDTGFPVDHGALRRELGPDVLIQGGPEVALLRGNSADAVYGRTRDILLSGIKEGGRFVLRDANNLPPCCPHDNLAAMYEACLEFGGYPA